MHGTTDLIPQEIITHALRFGQIQPVQMFRNWREILQDLLFPATQDVWTGAGTQRARCEVFVTRGELGGRDS
jgi:hypothetical protein